MNEHSNKEETKAAINGNGRANNNGTFSGPNHNLNEDEEAPINHHGGSSHNHHHHLQSPRDPRELHTAESIMEYMQELEEEKTDPPQYRDYLKAQKHLKQARRRRSAFGILDESIGGEAPTLQSVPSRRDLMKRFQSVRKSGDHGSSNEHRNKSLRALNIRMGSRQGSALLGPGAFMSDKSNQQSKQDHHNDGIKEEDEDNNEASLSNIELEDTKPSQDSTEEDDHNDHGGHSLSVPWYCRPVQRQRWDDDQVLPHINWGDLFFDLFYVAAAYNLGGMLISAMNTTDWPRGVVYFIGIFGPLYNIWENDVIYSSRYTLVDYAHRMIAVIRFLCVSFAVLSIKPIHLLGDKTSVETFCLTLALFCESIMQLGLNLELYFWGEGDRTAIQNHTYRKIISQFVPASLTYMVAALIAGISFFSAHLDDHDDPHEYGHDEKHHDDHGYDNDYYNSTTSDHYDNNDYYNSTASDHYADNDDHVGDYDTDDHTDGHMLFRFLAAAAAAPTSTDCKEDDGHRLLAGGADSYNTDCTQSEGIQWSIADVPILLCLAIYVIGILVNLFRKYTNDAGSITPGQQDIREHYVPNNIDYMIHRYGEWIMLMIGESILSLLIVETIEAREYYAIAGLGCLTVIVLQMLKFESEPSHADGHALWRSMLAASLFSVLIQILSMGLIAFGVSYKIMLTNVFQEEVEHLDDQHRRLAAIPIISDKAVASLFSGALCIVLLSLEMMLGTHKGVTKSYGLLFHEIESFHVFSLNWPLVMISIFKIGLIIFTATLSLWATEPVKVTVIGFFIVTSMAITRIVGWGFVHHEEEIIGALTFVADQTKDLGKNVIQPIQSMGTDILQTTHSVARTTGSMAKKTLMVMNNSMGSTSFNSTDELAIDKALWDTAFDAVVVTDRIGEIKYVNQTTLKEFGYDSETDLLGNNVSMLVGGGQSHYHHVYMERFNKNEKTSTTIGKQRQLKACRNDGSEFPCLIGIREIPNSALLVGYIRPMTEVTQGENDYHVDDTSFDSIIVINPKGVIIDVNITTLSEFGFGSKEELVGNNISMLVGGGEADYHDAYLANFQEEKRDASTIGNHRVLHAKRKDGNEFPCVIGIKRTPDGVNLIGYVRNMSGITPEDIALKEKTKYLVDDTSFDSIIVTDAEGIMLQVNATAVEDFGYSAKAELIGQNVKILVGGGHAKHHDRYVKQFAKKKKEETAIGKQRTLKARRKDGTDFTCVIGVKALPGTPYMIGYIRSTEGLTKKQVAAEYDSVSAISTARFGQSGGASIGSVPRSKAGSNSVESGGDILDESFDAIVVADFKGVIKRVNQTVLDIFRYESKDELVGQNISMLVGGPDAEMHDMYLERFQEQGKSESQIGKQRVLYSKRKDGTEFPCIVGIKRTPKNDGLVGWIRDMSDIQEQETRSSIQITNMNLLDPVERLVDDTSFDAIIVTDFKGVIQRVNKTTVREFRYASKEELIGRNVSDLVGGKVKARTHDKYMEHFQKAGKSSSTIGKQRVLKSKRKDGTEFRCIIGINKIADTKDDLLIGYIRNLEITFEESQPPTSQAEVTQQSSQAEVTSSSSDDDAPCHDSLGGFSAYSEC